MKKSKNNIIIILLILLVITIFGINIFLVINKNLGNNKETNIEEEISDKTVETLSIDNSEYIGYLKIDSIGLNAPIKEGTDLKTLKEAIGHFSETPFFSGNICLASHNRGSKQNFFENLKDIELNAEVSYITKYSEQKYYVSEIKEIEETDLSVLNSTENNQLTMITCVANKREKRLCVIATEINSSLEEINQEEL